MCLVKISPAFRDLVYTPERKTVFMCFRAASSNVNNSEAAHAVSSGLHPLAFTTAKGSSHVNEAVSSGCGQLHLLSLITLGPGCQRWCGGGGDLNSALAARR